MFDDDLALAERIRRTFDLVSSALPLQRIGKGFKSVVLGSPAGLVFRVALNKKAQAGHRRECYVLPKIKSLLPVEVPDVLGYCEVSEDFPFGVMMQRHIEGQNLRSVLKRSQRIEPVAAMTGELIMAIQSIRREDLPELPASTAPPPEKNWAYARAYLESALTSHELQKAEDWWARFCQDVESVSPEHRFYHGDLWHEHIIFDPKFDLADESRIAGVLDWEYAGFGDPIVDFIPFLSLEREFVTNMLETCRAKGGAFDADVISRIDLYLPFRELCGLCYCLEIGDEQEARCCLEKFRKVLGSS